MRKLRVGIVGTGGIWKSHVPGWNNSPNAELYALCDLNPNALKNASEATGVKVLYQRSEDLFADPNVDIVDVCTANCYHAPLVLAALESGKHVLCEKPLGITPEEIKKMIAARDKSAKLLMTAQHYRFQTSCQALKAEIDGGLLGNIYHARCWYLRRASAPTRLSFVSKAHSGGGPCIDIGVHVLDLALWLMGNPHPLSVSGTTQQLLARRPDAFIGNGRPIPEYWDVEDFACAFVRFENGASLIIEVSWMLHHSAAWDEQSVFLYGTKGGSKWPANEIATSNLKSKAHHDLRISPVDNAVEAHAAECMAFAKAIVNGAPSPVPPEQSLDVMTILDGVYKSAMSTREVVLER